MIIGVGIDLIEVSRIKKSVANNETFLSKVYTDREIAKCRTSSSEYQCLAARFAAKEAFMKAVGTGWAKGIRWSEIQTLNQESGRPYITLSGKAEEIAAELGVEKINLSLSHIADIASAIVILEK